MNLNSPSYQTFASFLGWFHLYNLKNQIQLKTGFAISFVSSSKKRHPQNRLVRLRKNSLPSNNPYPESYPLNGAQTIVRKVSIRISVIVSLLLLRTKKYDPITCPTPIIKPSWMFLNLSSMMSSWSILIYENYEPTALFLHRHHFLPKCQIINACHFWTQYGSPAEPCLPSLG